MLLQGNKSRGRDSFPSPEITKYTEVEGQDGKSACVLAENLGFGSQCLHGGSQLFVIPSDSAPGIYIYYIHTQAKHSGTEEEYYR